MIFRKVGERFQVSRITGLHFNYLGIEFSSVPMDRPPMVDLKNPMRGSYLAPEDVLANVLIGLDQARRDTGKQWFPKTVYFVSDDTPPLEIYQELARQLAIRAWDGGPFED